MALRGVKFAISFRRTLCQPTVRHLRTKSQAKEDEWEANLDSGGALASNESYELTKYGAIRRDKDNRPHRHGEFDQAAPEKPLLGFDIPIPKSYSRGAKEAEDRVKSRSTLKTTSEEKRKEARKRDIEYKTVKKDLKEDAEHYGASEADIRSAFDAVKVELKKRDEPPVNEKFDSFGFRILKAEIKPQIWTMEKEEVFRCLMRNILFDSPELFILDKPYGLVTQGGTLNDKMDLMTHLDAMAKALGVEKLYLVHRLDKDVTGCLCIAKSKEIADTIKAMFKARQVNKEYVAIIRGVPAVSEGTIDYYIAEGTIGDRTRMVIVPTAEPGSKKSVPKFSKVFPAVTKYKIIEASPYAAFVRLWPVTGYKHQLRVHLGFGLNCPILGDHKYTNKRVLGPQKLSGVLLDKLKVRQQKVRDIPLHLHSRHMTIPGILEGGRNLLVKSSVPVFFKKNLDRLKIRF